MGGAGGFVRPVGGTGVVKIFFPACRNGLADHVLLAVGAEQKSRKGIDRLFLYGDSGIPAQQSAHGTKIHLADDRLMGAGDPDPLVLRFLHQLLDFIIWPPGLSLNHHTDIEGVLQDAPNRYRRPLGLRVALEAGEVYPERFLAMCAGDPVGNLAINGIHAIEPAFGLPALWIEGKDKDMAEMSGYTVVSASAVISTHITEVIKKCASEILSRYDVQQLIDNLKKEVSEDYVNDMMKDITVGDVQIVMQNLLKEGVAVRDLKTILETISLQAKINKNPNFLTEHVRQALSRNICKQNLADTGELYVITLAPDVENTIARGASPDGQSVTLDPSFTKNMFDKMNLELEKAITATGNQPVILCSSPIRLLFRKLVERTYPQIAIMSYNEISPNVKVKSVGMVKA